MRNILIFTTLFRLVRLPLGADPPDLCELHWSDLLFPLYSSLSTLSPGTSCVWISTSRIIGMTLNIANQNEVDAKCVYTLFLSYAIEAHRAHGIIFTGTTPACNTSTSVRIRRNRRRHVGRHFCQHVERRRPIEQGAPFDLQRKLASSALTIHGGRSSRLTSSRQDGESCAVMLAPGNTS